MLLLPQLEHVQSTPKVLPGLSLLPLTSNCTSLLPFSFSTSLTTTTKTQKQLFLYLHILTLAVSASALFPLAFPFCRFPRSSPANRASSWRRTSPQIGSSTRIKTNRTFNKQTLGQFKSLGANHCRNLPSKPLRPASSDQQDCRPAPYSQLCCKISLLFLSSRVFRSSSERSDFASLGLEPIIRTSRGSCLSQLPIWLRSKTS
jgi:hypothetical protein